MGTVAELSGVSKRYGQVEALNAVDIAVRPGELTAILGPNGAGKTTAISVMLGLRRPTTGTARLFGLEPRDRRARSRCGVMLQESGVPGTLKVRELVDLFRSYYPAPLPAEAALRSAGLQDKAGTLVSKLSGGERQRVYYALAICGDPALLFLDEPTVGLDVESRRALMADTRRAVEKGRTVVLTTHYLEEADQLADRVIVIDRGRVIADATPGEIKSRVAAKRISFTTPRPVPREAFTDLPVKNVQVNDHRVQLLSSEPENVLRELFKRNVPVQDLEVAGAALEEAFIALTAQQGVAE